MQHGSARPWAVKYIKVHGRVHSDHGRWSSARLRLVPGSVAPEASNKIPCSLARASASRTKRSSSASTRSNSDWSARESPWPSGKNTMRCKCTSGTSRSAARSTNAGSWPIVSLSPVSHSDTRGIEAALERAELAHVLHDAVECVLAAHRLERHGLGGVERHAQLVEAACDQIAAAPLVEQGAVGVEQHVGAALLEIADHAREIRHHQRLADAVQHHPGDRRILIDDRAEQVPAHVGGGLELLEGARAGGAWQVAAVGRLQIEADRI